MSDITPETPCALYYISTVCTKCEEHYLSHGFSVLTEEADMKKQIENEIKVSTCLKCGGPILLLAIIAYKTGKFEVLMGIYQQD